MVEFKTRIKFLKAKKKDKECSIMVVGDHNTTGFKLDDSSIEYTSSIKKEKEGD